MSEAEGLTFELKAARNEIEIADAEIERLRVQLQRLTASLEDEREACAKVVDSHRPDASFDDSPAGYVERDALLKNIAAAIRARKEKA